MFIIRWLGPLLIIGFALASAFILWFLTRRGRFADPSPVHWSERAAQAAEAENAVWLVGGLLLALTPGALRTNGQFSAIPDPYVGAIFVTIIIGSGFLLLRRNPSSRPDPQAPSLPIHQRLLEALPTAAYASARIALPLAPSLWGSGTTALILISGAILTTASSRMQARLWRLFGMLADPPATWLGSARRAGVTADSIMDVASTRAWVRNEPGQAIRISSEARRLLSDEELNAVVARVPASTARAVIATTIEKLGPLSVFALLGFLGTGSVPAWPFLVIIMASAAHSFITGSFDQQQSPETSMDSGQYVAGLERLYSANLFPAEWFHQRLQPSLHDQAAQIGAEPSFERPRRPSHERAGIGIVSVATVALLGGALLPGIASEGTSELDAAVSIATANDLHLEAAYELAATTTQTGTKFSIVDIREYYNHRAVHAAYGLILEVADGCSPRLRIDRHDRINFCD